jgi:hypothetical protein
MRFYFEMSQTSRETMMVDKCQRSRSRRIRNDKDQ